MVVENIKEMKAKKRREIMGQDSPRVKGFMLYLENLCQKWYWLAAQCQGPGRPIFRQFKARVMIGGNVSVPVSVFSDLMKMSANKVLDRISSHKSKHNPKGKG